MLAIPIVVLDLEQRTAVLVATTIRAPVNLDKEANALSVGVSKDRESDLKRSMLTQSGARVPPPSARGY